MTIKEFEEKLQEVKEKQGLTGDEEITVLFNPNARYTIVDVGFDEDAVEIHWMC